MAASILWWYWVVSTVGFVVAFIFYYHVPLPKQLREFLMYGKVRTKGQQNVFGRYMDVPKRWFKHFYLTSVICNGFIFYTVVCSFFMNQTTPPWFTKLLGNVSQYPASHPTVSHTSVLIAQCMMVFQGTRRFLECQLITKTSDSKMNFIHYLLGMTFYPALGPTILSQGPDLSGRAPYKNVADVLNYIEWYHILGICLFLWGSWHQYRINIIFANLRSKDVDKNTHKIPYGDWFEYVSNPHYLAEIIIYIGGAVVLGCQHTLWWWVLAFVISNQVAAGSAYHTWYKEKFEDYPAHRKIIIPWIY
ncbi:polyprenal reductase-like [Ptychodera flava]|uniref:polyprenal reductase-like n=1 Tax=Ptychodera flava TaxID=63121 RepID=UPI00396A6AEF